MNWLASNWFFILFAAGMVWMHLRHGGHGGHGDRHQPSPPADRHDGGGADHIGHAALAKSPTTAGARSDGHVGDHSTGPKEVV